MTGSLIVVLSSAGRTTCTCRRSWLACMCLSCCAWEGGLGFGFRPNKRGSSVLFLLLFSFVSTQFLSCFLIYLQLDNVVQVRGGCSGLRVRLRAVFRRGRGHRLRMLQLMPPYSRPPALMGAPLAPDTHGLGVVDLGRLRRAHARVHVSHALHDQRRHVVRLQQPLSADHPVADVQGQMQRRQLLQQLAAHPRVAQHAPAMRFVRHLAIDPIALLDGLRR